jgi:hypothetical protein
VSRETQDDTSRADRRRDRRNNVKVRYIRGQTGRHGRGYNSRHQDYRDGRNFNGCARGRVGEFDLSRLNPTAPRFDPKDDRPLVSQDTGSDRGCSDAAQNLND